MSEEAAALAKFFNFCRNGSIDDVETLMKDELFPLWREKFKRKATKKQKRKLHQVENHQPDELKEDEVEVPWLKKQKTECGGEEQSAVQNPESGKKINLSRRALSPLSRLFDAIDDEEEKKYLMHRLREFATKRDNLQRAGVHLAAHAGNAQLLSMFFRDLPDHQPVVSVSIGAQANMQAIHFAASAGHLDALKECVTSGAKINAAATRGHKTPLQLAQSRDHQNIIDYLSVKGGRLRGLQAEMAEDSEFMAVVSKLEKRVPKTLSGKGQESAEIDRDDPQTSPEESPNS